MTAAEIIEKVDGVKPNAYTDEDKLGWLNELEYAIQTDVYDLAEGFTAHDSAEEDLLLGPEWGRLYTSWLEARIAAANGEFDEYANLMQIHNGFSGEFERWYARHHVDPDD